MTKHKIYQKFIKCACGAHAIEIRYDKDPKWGYADLAFWAEGGYRGPLTFWQKLTWIWHIIWCGAVYADQFCLNDVNIDELITELKNVKEALKN